MSATVPTSSRIPIAPERPTSITVAVRLMIAGAVVAGLRALIPIIWSDQIRANAIEQAGAQAETLSPSQLDTVVASALGGAVVGALLSALLWVWMAWANHGGRRWARIVGTVFFAFSAISFLYGFAAPGLPVEYVVGAVSLIIGAAATIALWRPSSSEYIARCSQR